MDRLLSLSIVKAERSRNPLRIHKGLTIHSSMKSWWYILGNLLIIHSCHLWLWEHVMEIFDEVWIRGVFIQSSKVLEESGLLKGPENLLKKKKKNSSIERTNWTSVSFKLTVRQNKILGVRSLGLVKVILIRLNSELQKSSPNGNHSRLNLQLPYLSFWNLWQLRRTRYFMFVMKFSNILDFLSLLAFIAGKMCLRSTPQITLWCSKYWCFSCSYFEVLKGIIDYVDTSFS